MEKSVLNSSPCETGFWKSIQILLLNPQATNRQIRGYVSEIVLEFSCLKTKTIYEIIKTSFQGEISDSIKVLQNHPQFICTHQDEKAVLESLVDVSKASFNFIWIVKLLHKNPKTVSYRVYFLDFTRNSVTIFVPATVQNSSECYFIDWDNQCLNVGVYKGFEESNQEWLIKVVQPKLLKWASDPENNSSPKLKSLSMIDLEEYNTLYNDLKVKYGTEMVKIWPERTDPAKFVYEDVAIATYLILLWKKEREVLKTTKLQSFVDLGCGNGLLVYILAQENHPGLGIDLRKRGIWDIYPKNTNLKVETIIPSDTNLFPDYDWIIGNHSDELSPWVPVIAARSSYKTNFFLLPCCAYEFNGQKFQRRNSKKSQYLDFLDYAQEISTVCGFQTSLDRLKIPSTKRICVIGMGRNFKIDELPDVSLRISAFINKDDKSDKWCVDFKPRDSVEVVRNCTKISRSIRDEIVKLVLGKILEVKNYDESIAVGKWNLGGNLPISEIISVIPKETLLQLKAECGGVQTLLKNNHQLFRIEKGKVQIRFPKTVKEKTEELKSNSNVQFKKSDCFFQLYHSDGCPLSSEDCTFRHSNE